MVKYALYYGVVLISLYFLYSSGSGYEMVEIPYPISAQLDETNSLQGIITNDDGIRDDIYHMILTSKMTAQQKLQAKKVAGNLQSALLVNLDDEKAIRNLDDVMMESLGCFARTFDNPADGFNTFQWLQKSIANTESRAKAYLNYNNAQDGTVIRLPMVYHCDEGS
ncbi:hypothetical protein [Vibrio sp. WXL103]|uniref:hypothetical protein n=1 Tax=Vibrio sp. WXL103 TaxID=3450710 RepID=UPI003EC58A28